MTRTPIQDATDRLRALASLQPLGSQIYMTGSRLLQDDLTTVLDELHRLHIAVSEQRAQLERRKMSKPRKSLATEIQRISRKKHASGQPGTHEHKAPRPAGPREKRK